MLTCHRYVQIDSGRGRLVDDVGGTTICKNFNYTYPSTICVQYLKILLSSLREKEFQRLTMFKLSLAIVDSPIMGWLHHLKKLITHTQGLFCYLCAISKNSPIM